MQVVVDGLLTNYQILGDKKETLLILPGWRCSLNEWLPVAKILSNKYQVVLLDLPGFGATAMPKETFGIYEYADFVKKFLVKLNIKKCIVLGHSFGGRIGIILASERGIVNKLILVDSAGIENKSLYVKLTRLLKKIVRPALILLPNQVQNNIRNLIGSKDYKNAYQLRKIFVKIVNQSLRQLFPNIKVATIIIWGDKDNQLPVTQTKIFKKEIKNSLVRIVWGAGHNPHLEKPEQFMSILNDVL